MGDTSNRQQDVNRKTGSERRGIPGEEREDFVSGGQQGQDQPGQGGREGQGGRQGQGGQGGQGGRQENERQGGQQGGKSGQKQGGGSR
jgi:protein Tex